MGIELSVYTILVMGNYITIEQIHVRLTKPTAGSFVPVWRADILQAYVHYLHSIAASRSQTMAFVFKARLSKFYYSGAIATKRLDLWNHYFWRTRVHVTCDGRESILN